MTENKENKSPIETNSAAPETKLASRRVNLDSSDPIGEYKKAKAQFETERTDNERKEKEIKEKDEDQTEEKLDAWLATEPSPKEKVAVSYEIKTGEGTPNITYNLPPGQEAPKDAVKVNYAPASTEKPKSQEEIALDKKREEEKKLVLDALAKKHDAEIEKVLGEFDFSTLTDEEKKTIHANALSEAISPTALTETDKQEALKWLGLEGKVDITKLTAEQIKMVQRYKSKKYLEALAAAPNENIEALEQKNPGIKNFMDEVSKRHPLWPNDFLGNPNRLFDQEKFFEEVKKDPKILSETIKSIRDEGFLLSGIQRDSKLGQALSWVIKGNVEEYLELNKANTGVVDIDHFKWLKDVLGWSYNDLLFSDEFLLGDSHELKHTRDVIMQLMEDEMAQIPRPEPGDTAGIQQYQQAAQNTISSNLGVNNGVAEKVMWHISRWNLSPFVRFLADLFAPLGALFGGEVGDFWRRYLHETGMAKWDASGYPGGEWWSVSSAPYNGTPENPSQYIEWASGSAIIGAAQQYVWRNESRDWEWIREVHKSGWLNAGGWTAWCMSFVQHVLRKDMGYTDAQIGTGKTAWAADGRKMGKHVAKEDVQPGDIALVHGAGASGYHIGFVAWVDKAKWTYWLLWGNQGKGEVSIREEKIANAREFRGFEARKESSQPNPQLSDGKEAVGNTAISQKALEWQKAGDIHGAVHCTDWINKIYQEVTGKEVYDAQTYYDGVRKIWGWTGIGGVHAPKEQIANIREGQHLIVDHGNNGGKTHSVIALWTPDSAWRVQVVSYPNYGKPPKVEWYTLWENTSAWQKRVLRIQWVWGGWGPPSVASAPSSTPPGSSNSASWTAPESSSVPVSGSDVDSLIEQIKQNESGNRGLEWYATYDNGENFPSMWFAHFIWGTNTGHGNSFHDMMNFITQKRGISVPAQLNFLKNPNPPSNWGGNSSMRKDPNYRAVTEFLSRSDVKRAWYDFIKNDKLDSLKSGLTGDELHKFNLIAQWPKGAYILTDYVNFKWSWTPWSRTSWWLVNVLEAMQTPANPEDAARKFSEAAKYVLRSRRPSDYAKFSWWAKRVEGYA